jgi:hypothetical protein
MNVSLIGLTNISAAKTSNHCMEDDFLTTTNTPRIRLTSVQVSVGTSRFDEEAGDLSSCRQCLKYGVLLAGGAFYYEGCPNLSRKEVKTRILRTVHASSLLQRASIYTVLEWSH